MPNGTPPHKEKRINELDKIKLVNFALSHINNLIIDEREILKRSPSYAYLTLKEIQKAVSYTHLTLPTKRIV